MSDNKITEREESLRAKIRAGLTREQAEQVIDAQTAHDAAENPEAAKAASEKAAAAKAAAEKAAEAKAEADAKKKGSGK